MLNNLTGYKPYNDLMLYEKKIAINSLFFVIQSMLLPFKHS